MQGKGLEGTRLRMRGVGHEGFCPLVPSGGQLAAGNHAADGSVSVGLAELKHGGQDRERHGLVVRQSEEDPRSQGRVSELRVKERLVSRNVAADELPGLDAKG